MVDRDSGQPWDKHITEDGMFRGASLDVENPARMVRLLTYYGHSLPADKRPTEEAGGVWSLVEWDSLEQEQKFWANAARRNQERRRESLEFFESGARSAEDIIAQYPELTPHVLHQLTYTEQLLSKRVDDTLFYPGWQFDESGICPELPSILERIAEFTTDPLAADRIMRLERVELGNRTVQEAMSDHTDPQGQQDAWWILDTLGGYR